MENRLEQTSEKPKFEVGMPVRVKGTAEKTLNGEFLPNGVTGFIEKIESDKVYVSYIIPGDGIDKKTPPGTKKTFPFTFEQIEEITS